LCRPNNGSKLSFTGILYKLLMYGILTFAYTYNTAFKPVLGELCKKHSVCLFKIQNQKCFWGGSSDPSPAGRGHLLPTPHSFRCSNPEFPEFFFRKRSMPGGMLWSVPPLIFDPLKNYTVNITLIINKIYTNNKQAVYLHHFACFSSGIWCRSRRRGLEMVSRRIFPTSRSRLGFKVKRLGLRPQGRVQKCETTVSLATYNNQIHRQITQNTLKLIMRRK